MLLEDSRVSPSEGSMTDRGVGGAVASHGLDANSLVGKEIDFPTGLLGFPAHRRFRLERFKPSDGGPSPFFILCSLDQQLSFPLIHPNSLALDYRPQVTPEVLVALRGHSTDESMFLLIVTVRDRLEEITVNLQGPLVINPGTALGVQVVLEEYPIRYPLLKEQKA